MTRSLLSTHLGISQGQSDLLRLDQSIAFLRTKSASSHHLPQVSLSKYLDVKPSKMAPCECGEQFRDLTDWKAHSTRTGYCCIYKCRRLASAASIPGFAFGTATSATFGNYPSPWNALAPSHYKSLNSPPALELETHPFVPSSTGSAITTALIPCQAPLPAPPEPISTTSSAPKASNIPTVAPSSARKTMTPNSMSTKSMPEYLSHRRHGCSHCHRAFRMEESLQKHYEASRPERSYQQICDTCKKSFTNANALQDHQRTKKHCYCNECQQAFECESNLLKHLDIFHASQFRCCDCEQDFVSEHALDQHLNDKFHETVRCQVCSQDLFSKAALDQYIVVEHNAIRNPKRKKVDLDQHLNSLKHRPLSDIACVGSDKCKRRFNSPSALIQHLESGARCSGIDRHAVNKLVQDNDTGRTISNGLVAQSLLEYNQNPSEYSSSNGTPVLTPTSSATSSPVPTPMTRHVFEQPMPFLSLDTDISSFTTILMALSVNGMDKSLPSVIPYRDHAPHAPVLFHCPGALESTEPHGVSPREFTLSGLAQHIESGACGDGPATLKKVMEFVQERLEQMGLGSIHLLK